MNRYVTEFIGTFFLVFAIGMVIVAAERGGPTGTGADLGGPLAIGAVLMAMVYMGRPVSGGHYNPAITLAVNMVGGMRKGDALPYMGAQVIGAWLSAGCVYLITGSTFAPGPALWADAGSALLAEFLVTFALVLVFLHVVTAEAAKGNQYYGFAIGAVVAAGTYAIGPVSGAALNPAVAIGPMIVDTLSGSGAIGSVWLYLVAPVLGAIAAVPVFKMQVAEHWTT